MRKAMELRTILLNSDTSQGVVLSVTGDVATVALPGGTRNVTADITVEAQDRVTVRAGRIIAKRTGGVGGAVKRYRV